MTPPFKEPFNHRPNHHAASDFTALCGCGQPSITAEIPGLYEFHRQGLPLPVACRVHYRASLLHTFSWPGKPKNFSLEDATRLSREFLDAFPAVKRHLMGYRLDGHET